MIMLKIISISLIGGVIGYLTNYLAIVMLFHPYKEMRFFNLRLPFTPGVIPGDKPKFAKAIGNIVRTHLVSDEAIRDKLHHEAFSKEVEQYVDQNVRKFVPFEPMARKGSQFLSNIALAAMRKHVPTIVRTINIPDVIEERIKQYEAEKLKELVYKVSYKHLRYITVLGGVIGTVIGAFQAVLFQYL
jgi:uncharacterized membrane protein YheB (UPF0754 family)